MKITSLMRNVFLASTVGFMALPLAGCDRKEEVLDVETPEGDVEVERDPVTGETDVDAD